MPEITETQSGIEISAVTDVPIRHGEERSQASLNLQHQQARAAEIRELREQLNRLEGTQKPFNPKDAKSSSKRRRAVIEKWEELKGATFWNEAVEQWQGPCPPATVINFNPLSLHLDGELQRWSVPSANDKTAKSVKLSFNGRTFQGAYMTIADPHVWPVITGAQDGLLGIDISIEARYIPPIGLAHQFFEHYVVGAADAQGMGGVLIFQGDIHAIEKNRLARMASQILVPSKHLMLDGSGRVTYSVDLQPFDACVANCFSQQRNYANTVVAEGHSFANSSADAIKNQLSSYHILWHNWSLDRGYKKEAEKWASERLDDGPNIEAVHCPDCHQRQASPAQYFCANCNAPFDACKAFLAGKSVSADRLEAYDVDSKEFQLILAEVKRRNANRALLNTLAVGDEAPKTAKQKKAEKPE